MPLGSSKFFSKNHTAGAGGLDPVDPVNVVITSTVLTGQSDSTLTVDANMVTVAFTINRSSPLGGIAVGYEISGNISASDFTDGTLSGNISTVNGIGGLNKTISTTTGGGAKDFVIKLVRPDARTDVLDTTNTIHIYEVIPATVTGGDSTQTSSFVTADANGNNHIIGNKVHFFTSTGNASITITNKGNLEGNANIWNTFFNTTSNLSYWNSTESDAVGLKFRSLLVAGGGGGSSGGAGEVGSLGYPFANVATGTYTMTVGQAVASGVEGQAINNTTIFNGNVSLSRTATRGGSNFGLNPTLDVGAPGGSGAGQISGTSGNYNGWSNIALDIGYGIGKGETDLVDRTAGFPNFRDNVEWATGNHGEQAGGSSAKGGGALGRPEGPGGGVSTSLYGTLLRKSAAGTGASGVSWPGLKDGIQTDVYGTGTPGDRFPVRWFDSPIYTANANVDVAFAGSSGGTGDNNWGGTSEAGVVTISYPYVVATRFLSTTDLS